MGMADILVVWPGPFEQTFVPPSHGDPIWNLASIGALVSEKKMFEERVWTTDRQQTTEAYLSYKLNNNEPSAHVSLKHGTHFNKTLHTRVEYNNWIKQVAQRATISHLRASMPRKAFFSNKLGQDAQNKYAQGQVTLK